MPPATQSLGHRCAVIRPRAMSSNHLLRTLGKDSQKIYSWNVHHERATPCLARKTQEQNCAPNQRINGLQIVLFHDLTDKLSAHFEAERGPPRAVENAHTHPNVCSCQRAPVAVKVPGVPTSICLGDRYKEVADGYFAMGRNKGQIASSKGWGGNQKPEQLLDVSLNLRSSGLPPTSEAPAARSALSMRHSCRLRLGPFSSAQTEDDFRIIGFKTLHHLVTFFPPGVFGSNRKPTIIEMDCSEACCSPGCGCLSEVGRLIASRAEKVVTQSLNFLCRKVAELYRYVVTIRSCIECGIHNPPKSLSLHNCGRAATQSDFSYTPAKWSVWRMQRDCTAAPKGAC